jgi:hypothetical protein
MAINFTLKKISLGIILLSSVQFAKAQFKGGSDDGADFAVAFNQPLGRNIFRGGVDDGTDFAIANNQPLGRNIFRGGVDDGADFAAAFSQPLGRNIFFGGADDGTDFAIANNQPLGRNIFRGGVDDGTDFAIANNQPLGRNIYTGGANDGWAMAFVANTPLPITLSDFNGRWQQNDGLLFWKTTTEINSSHFELERSFDGNSYTKIQTVNAAGQSNTTLNYSYTDVNIKKLVPANINSIYYRLRSVDKDGSATYSGVVVLKVSNTNEVEYAVFPNPAKDFVTITATQLPAVENAYIRLADVTGKVLILQKMTSSRQQISVSPYPNGTYFLQLITSDKVVYTQKIIIRK